MRDAPSSRGRRLATHDVVHGEQRPDPRVARLDVASLRHEGRAEPTHPYANDLDLLGHGSLLHVLESTGTRLGDWRQVQSR